MSTIRIEVDSRDLEILRASAMKFPKESTIALSNALNRSAVKARTLMAKEAREHYNVKSGAVKKTITMKKATPSRLVAENISSDKMQKLSNFPYKVMNTATVRTPVSVSVKRGAGGVPSVKPPIFYGKGELYRRRSFGDRRLSMGMTLSIPQMISNEEVFENIQRESSRILHERLIHELWYRHALCFDSLY